MKGISLEQLQNDRNFAIQELRIYCKKRKISRSMERKMKDHALTDDPFAVMTPETIQKGIDNIYAITRRGQKRRKLQKKHSQKSNQNKPYDTLRRATARNQKQLQTLHENNV